MFWVEARNLRFWGLETGTRMSIVRLSGGGLFVHSPVALDAETKRLVLLLMPIIVTEYKDSSAYSALRIKIQKSVNTIINHQKKILLIGILMIAGCLWFLPQLEYEYNYAKLQIGNLSSYEIKNEINKKFGFASDVFLYRTTGIERAKDIKRKLEISDKIGYVLSISEYLQTNEKLSNNNSIVRKIINSTQFIKINELNLNELK